MVHVIQMRLGARPAVECRSVMWRRLYNFATLTSLLVGILSIGLVARGKWTRDHLTWARKGGNFVEVNLQDGCAVLSIVPSDADRAMGWQVVSRDATAYPASVIYGHPSYRHREAGVVMVDTSDETAVLWSWGERSPIQPGVRVIWHWGMIALLAAVLPTSWAGKWIWTAHKRRVSRTTGCCPSCSYDLRATPDICPECGTAVPPPHNPPL
jgi:hypothetical protein